MTTEAVALPDEPARDEFRVSVNSDPGPGVTHPRLVPPDPDVFLLGPNRHGQHDMVREWDERE